MKQKLILIVEDNEFLGSNMKEALEDRGFRAVHALNREMALSQEEAPDVVILDMNLGEKRSGAEVGMELKSKFRSQSPEFIIYSAYDDRKYLLSAIRLGAAVYLEKAQKDYRTVITHARILAIRGVIRNSLQAIRALVKECDTVPNAIRTAAQKILAPELHECLGAGFFVLFSCNGEHECIANNQGLQEENPGYDLIQQLSRELISPEFLDLEKQPLDPASQKKGIRPHITTLQAQLGKAIVLNLYDRDEIQLSLGIVRRTNDLGGIEEEAEALAEVIGRHFRSELMEKLFLTTHLFAEQAINKRKQLDMAGSFCLNLGGIHEELYRKAEEMGEIAPGATILPGFVRLGRELQTVGKLLETAREKPKTDRIVMSALVEKVWSDLVVERQLSEDQLEMVNLGEVEGHFGSLFVAVKRILEWMVDRFSKCVHSEPKIKVTQESAPNGFCNIGFQDCSKRLPTVLLRDVFQPFSSGSNQEIENVEASVGLFTARTLVEVKNNGRLTEQSWKLGEGYGHLFELWLLPPQTMTGEAVQG